MATKKIELEKMAQGLGCLGKAADDEPVFILRASDVLAPEIVAEWASRLKEITEYPGPVAKLDEARALAQQMRDWQHVNGCKVPD